MRLLLDTSIVIWAANEPSRLSLTARTALADPGNLRFISAISLWEISAKSSLKKLTLPLPLEAFVLELEARMVAELIDFSVEDSLFEHTLPQLHRDPFDRMLICQALSRQLVVVTSDEWIRGYPVPTLW